MFLSIVVGGALLPLLANPGANTKMSLNVLAARDRTAVQGGSYLENRS